MHQQQHTYVTMQTEPLHQQLSSPSFSSYSSETLAHIAARVIHEIRTDETLSASPQPNDNLTLTPKPNDDNDFEFAFLSTHPISSPVSADDIFHNGQITPTTYPLFDRTLLNGVVSAPHANAETAPRRRRLPLKKLMAEDGKELDGVAAGTYCVWTPPCKKSSSTGSSSKRWKLRDLLLRSHSDGKKESLVFLGPGGKHSSGNNGDAGAAKDGYRSKRKLGIGWVVQKWEWAFHFEAQIR